MDDLTGRVYAVLKDAGVENCSQEARWIVEDAADEVCALNYARRRADGEPLQYILGTAPFRDLMLYVDHRVLIPRPETESLVQWIIDHAPENASVLDLGTGSGAIILAALTERSDLSGTAVDISYDALAVAQKNAGLCHTDRIEFLQSDLFSALAGRRFDIVAANLPYVTEEEYPLLDREVRCYEPVLALTAPDNGLALIMKTIRELAGYLRPGGKAIFELSPPQAEIAAKALADAGFKSSIIKDLCGRNRFVTGELE